MEEVEHIERVRTCVYIDKKLLKEAKHQRLNISKILEDTLRDFLAEDGMLDRELNTHTHTNREDTKKIDIKKGRRVPQGKDVMFGSARVTRGHKVVMDIVKRMQEMGAWNQDDINRKIVERLAWKYGGTDPRTVKNYVDKVMSVWLYGEDSILPGVEKK